ncbi:hypothetical protein QJS10_CPA06g01624 [Acorus calamus]|uniref:Uncharacterized protein n=1 Tax=Acorus calamus TaxID=4465 RepID=A0AAV9EP70_ACOCL|nr:hypothetical protein QJS10_CPA06g01624 [Acorus calamus]
MDGDLFFLFLEILLRRVFGGDEDFGGVHFFDNHLSLRFITSPSSTNPPPPPASSPPPSAPRPVLENPFNVAQIYLPRHRRRRPVSGPSPLPNRTIFRLWSIRCSRLRCSDHTRPVVFMF